MTDVVCECESVCCSSGFNYSEHRKNSPTLPPPLLLEPPVAFPSSIWSLSRHFGKSKELSCFSPPVFEVTISWRELMSDLPTVAIAEAILYSCIATIAFAVRWPKDRCCSDSTAAMSSNEWPLRSISIIPWAAPAKSGVGYPSVMLRSAATKYFSEKGLSCCW